MQERGGKIDTNVLRALLGAAGLPEDELIAFGALVCERFRPAIRLRPDTRLSELLFATEPVPWYPHGRFVVSDHAPGAWAAYATGDYFVQTAGSMLSIALLQIRADDWVCDLCASPGGKSTAILEQLGSEGWLLVNEPIRGRLGALRFNLARHGAIRYALTAKDPQWLAEKVESQFDAVLVDAPCSGQALLGRGKQTVAAFRSQTIQHAAARQRRILASAARLVRPGGRLVYSTCTYAYDENEGQIIRFLDEHRDWRPSELDHLQKWRVDGFPGCYRVWPHRDRCAGAFAALLVREGEPRLGAPRSPFSPQSPMSRSTIDQWSEEWGNLIDVQWLDSGSRLFAWPSPAWHLAQPLGAEGPEVAFRKGRTWFPSYGLAMRRDRNWQVGQVAEFDDRETGAYLTGKSVPSNSCGWAVACWHGKPLGWVKGDGRHWKNHLPKPARMTTPI